MKFYYKNKKENNVTACLKGSYKIYGRRLPYFRDIEIEGYSWVEPQKIWLKDTKEYPEGAKTVSTCKRFNTPKSFKAFRRYVFKLMKEYDFPKGTRIQLCSNFIGLDIYCIV